MYNFRVVIAEIFKAISGYTLLALFITAYLEAASITADKGIMRPHCLWGEKWQCLRALVTH